MLSIVDERKAECPYCNKSLTKIPSSKTKCPHCGQYMFIRTRPHDRIRLVVTKEGVEQIQKETEDIFRENQALETKERMKRFIENSLSGLKMWKESGVVKEFQCITSARDSVCSFCAAQEGIIIPLEKVKVGINIPPFKQCLNYSTLGCCCGFKPVVDTQIRI